MISFLKGTIDHISDTALELEVGGVGYEVQVSPATASKLQRSGPEATVYTYTYVREDQIALYGFASRDELSLFRRLITVSGIGPKAGLSLLSAMSADDLRFAIMAGDARTISRAPGVGKRTAERLILELREKIGAEEAAEAAGALTSGETAGSGDMSGDAEEAAEALIALGYSRTEALRAVRKAKESGASGTEELLRSGLKLIR
ncbi:Holliday junction branch migration protein RuvA [Lachnoclostridium sp. Marseille-P6806]|uniref:Holliday junction branch migration protein RuvA n=1 Tax=Lachnoclostridium sp. Marseille-P6806 TaxID=2364793 RepID=UPI001031D10F|nr:Holliday junction branch migration protein RuvA [Lachnoclostridium sp. Marseille-P6806]